MREWEIHPLRPRDFLPPSRFPSLGHRGWISQYLPCFGGVQIFSSSSIHLQGWIRKSIPVHRVGLTVLKSILPCWWWENAQCGVPIRVAQVNLIPLIAKADSFTKEELQEFKQNVSIFTIFENLRFSFFCQKFSSCFLPFSRSATNWQVRRFHSTSSPPADTRLKSFESLLLQNWYFMLNF